MTRLSLVQGKQSTLLLLHHLINTVPTLTGDTLSLVQGKQSTILLLHHLINTVHTLTGDTAIPSSGKTVDHPTSTSLN